MNNEVLYCPYCLSKLKNNGGLLMWCPDSIRCEYEHCTCEENHEHLKYCQSSGMSYKDGHKWPFTYRQMLEEKKVQAIRQRDDYQNKVNEIELKISQLDENITSFDSD